MVMSNVTKIILRHSGTTGNVPNSSNLEFGEIAINYADGILYYKAANGTILSIKDSSGATGNGLSAFNQANLAFDQANTATEIAISAFDLSNTLNTTISSISGNQFSTVINVGSTSTTLQNLYFDLNTGGFFGYINDGDSSQLVEIGGTNFIEEAEAYIAMAAFDKANSANIVASAAFDRANVGSNQFTTVVNIETANVGLQNLYFDLATGGLFGYINDGESSQLIELGMGGGSFGLDADTTIANAAFDQANNANIIAVAAFNAANLANGGSIADVYNQANIARTHANGAFITANAALPNSGSQTFYGNLIVTGTLTVGTNTVIMYGNSGFIVADTLELSNLNVLSVLSSSFNQANIAFDIANSNSVIAAATFAQANASFDQANTAVTNAGAAYDQANTARDSANTATTSTGAAYDQANTTNVIAVLAFNNSNTKLNTSGGTITGDLTVSGNLTISGNTTLINVQTYSVSDPLIYLASNNYVTDLVDIGFIANYVNTTGSNVHTGLMRDSGTKEYYLFQGYDKEPENNHIDPNANNFTISFLNANIRSSNIILSGSNVDNWIQSSYNKANSANITADSAFARANAANLIANLAFDKANSANIIASGAFDKANTANVIAANAYNKANSANVIGANATIGFIIDGGGVAITTGQKGHLEIPFNATITQCTLLADVSGSANIEIWKAPYAAYPPVGSNTINSTGFLLTSTNKNQITSITTTTINAGDILAYNVASLSTITRLTISLKVIKT